MKKTIIIIALMLVTMSAWAYSFSAVASSGQTLYYTIVGSTVKVTIPGTAYNSDYWPSSYTKPRGALVIPNSVRNGSTTYTVTAIDEHCFHTCTGLTSVSIPSSVISIGSSAFHSCDSLSSINIPNSVTTINSYTFYSCEQLSSITLPSGLISIGSYAFTYCNLSSLVLPDGVVSIGSCAFQYNSSLSRITLGSSLTSIGDYAFQYCNALDSVVLPSTLTSIGAGAFGSCSNLTSIVIPNSITSINYGTFKSCYLMQRVTLPESLTTIAGEAFAFCNALDTVVIPSTVTSIGSAAFKGDIGLSCINIPDGVTTLPNETFQSCSHLTAITIPAAVTSIGNYCFRYCNGLTSITALPTLAPTVQSATFYQVPVATPVLVPCGSLATYTTSWTHFNNIIEDRLLLAVTSADTTMGSAQVVTTPACGDSSSVTISAAANRGYHFLRWSDFTTDNPYTFTITQDTLMVAYFVAATIDTLFVHDTTIVTDTLFVHDTTTVYDTIIVTEPMTYYGLTVISQNSDMGVGAGNGQFPEGCEVEIAAVPIEGYRFSHWDDGDTLNPRVVSVMGNQRYMAYFEETTADISATQLPSYRISSQHGCIVVEECPAMDVRIFDQLGRCIVNDHSRSLQRTYHLPAAGTYLVQVGPFPAHKVIHAD